MKLLKKIYPAITTITSFLGLEIMLFSITLLSITFLQQFPSLFELFYVWILAPFSEEIVFRMLPVTILQVLPKDKKIQLFWPIALFTSAVFGWVHGSQINILFQGVGGLFLFLTYYRHGYLAAVAYHAIWNILMTILPSLI